MKPNGRTDTIKGWPNKIDYHLHARGRKVGNWWHDCDTIRSRGHLKHVLRKLINKDIHDDSN